MSCLDGTAVDLLPITAEIAYVGTIGLSCELTIALEPMIAIAQVESAPLEGCNHCLDGTTVGLSPISAEIAHV